MRCKYCNAKLAAHDIWCVNCGRQSTIPKHELSALKSLSETWSELNKEPKKSYLIAAISAIMGFASLLALIWLFLSIHIELSANPTLSYVYSVILRAVAVSIFMPFLLMGIKPAVSTGLYTLDASNIKEAFSSYIKLWLLSIIICAYYAVIYLICFGLPSFGSDPILRLVWIVLANYGVAIFLPTPALIFARELNPWQACLKSYYHFHDIRWNLYLMGLVLIVINLLAAIPLLMGLLISLPLSWFAIRDYTFKLMQYELLEYRR